MNRLFDEIFKKIDPGYRDPCKLLAHTWMIDDEKTGIGMKVHHPWVCLDERHPDKGLNYHICVRSTTEPKNQLQERFSIWTPARILPKLDKAGYIKIYEARAYPEEIIDSGEQLGDMPEGIKREIREKWRLLRLKRKPDYERN